MPQTEIILQRLTPNDAEDFYALAHSDGEISRFLPSYVQDLISTQEMIKDFAEQYDEKWHYYYMIKAHKKNVGFISAEYSRLFLKGFYVTYFLGFQFRGMHYMSNALDILLQNLSTTSNLPCIFDIEVENHPSRHVIERLSPRLYCSYVDRNGKAFSTYLVYP